MKKYIGLAAFFGITLTLIWGIKLFAPEPQPPTEGIPHNYYHPDVWGSDSIIYPYITPLGDTIFDTMFYDYGLPEELPSVKVAD